MSNVSHDVTYLPPVRVVMVNDLQDVSSIERQTQVSTRNVAVLPGIVVKVGADIY